MDPRGTRRTPPQRSLLLTLAIAAIVSILTVYVLVGLHLRRFDRTVVSLSDELDRQSDIRATEMREMVLRLMNDTEGMERLLDSLSVGHSERIHTLSQELHNHSRLVALAMEQQSALYSDQIKDLSAAVRESTLGQSGFGVKQVQRTLSNQTKFTVATLHSQRRMEKDLMEVLRLVGEKSEGGKDFQKSVESTLEEVLLAMRRHTQVQQAAQETLDALSALLTSQKMTAGSGTTSKEEQEKIHEVLKALVAHLRTQDNNTTSATQSVLVQRLDSLLGELRNETALSAILRGVRQQSAALLKLRGQLAASPLLSGNGSDASPLDAALHGLQEEVQKQAGQLAEVGRKVDGLGGVGGDAGAGSGASLASLLAEMRSQTQVLTNLDERMNRLEERVGLRVQDQGGEGSQKGGEGQNQGRDVADPNTWRQHDLIGDPAKFLRYSAHQWGPSKVTAVGLGVRTIIESLKLSECRWTFVDGKKVQGSLEVLFATEDPSLQYEVTIMTCTLEVDVNEAGTGGHLSVDLDGTEFVLLRRDAEESDPPSSEPPSPHSFSLCLSPVSSPPSDFRLLKEFVELHRLTGAEKVRFFDSGGLGQPFSALFSAEIASGFVSVSPLFGLDRIDQQSSGGELLAYHDCLYSARKSKATHWLAFLEPNEAHFVEPPRNVPGVLSLAAKANVSWVTHGSIWWASQKCRPPFEPLEDAELAQSGGERFSIERMVFRWPFVLCHNTQQYSDRTFCLDGTGHRRLIIDPLKVRRVGLYSAHWESDAEGLHISSTEMAHFHFQNVLKGPVCSETIQQDEKIEWWYRNLDAFKLASSLRHGFRCNFSSDGCVSLEGSGKQPTVLPEEGATGLSWKTTKEVRDGNQGEKKLTAEGGGAATEDAETKSQAEGENGEKNDGEKTAETNGR